MYTLTVCDWNTLCHDMCPCVHVCADMAEVEKMVRSIEADGLLWGAGE